MPNPLYDRLFGVHEGSDRDFLILANGRTISYDAFLRLSARFANAVASLGLAPGDRLAVQIAKSPEALAVYAACAAAGVIFLPLNTAYTAAEVSYFVENAEAKLLLCDAAAEEALKPVAAAAGAQLLTLNADGSGSFASLAAGQLDRFTPVDRSEDDLAAFLYTSGTTGRSKGAMLTQANLLSNAETLKDYWRFTADDVLLHALPIF
ncbi:MAG: AMP-binding protein, partial [Pseudomonadota bacterium]